MIDTHIKGRENQGGETLFQAFGLGAFVAALTLLTAVPMHADTFYSGATVNSKHPCPLGALPPPARCPVTPRT